MKNKKYFQAYNIDLTYELNTYKFIGNDYGDSKNANLGLDLNVRRWLRKNITNKNEKKYKICNKYSEWKKYVLDNFPINALNKEDILHFLNKSRYFAIIYYDLIKIVLVPVYVAMLALMEHFYPYKTGFFMALIFIMAIIVIISTGVIIDANQKINFYNDYIHILEDEFIKKDTDKKN